MKTISALLILLSFQSARAATSTDQYLEQVITRLDRNGFAFLCQQELPQMALEDAVKRIGPTEITGLVHDEGGNKMCLVLKRVHSRRS